MFFTDVAKSDPVLATLLAFVTFAASFLARPFGSLLLGGQNAAMVVNFGIPSAPNLSPRARAKLQAGLFRFCYSAGFTTVSCILNGVTPRTLCGLPEVMTID